MCFNKSVILSSTFQRFWDNIEYYADVRKVIHHYETKLTTILLQHKFTYKALYCTNLSADVTINNHSFTRPDIILKHNIPLLKIKSFINLSYRKIIIELIKEKSSYPIELIYKYANEMLHPNLSLQICNKSIIAKSTQNSKISSKVAIHLHALHHDITIKYLEFLNNVSFDYDLYITTNSELKKNQIIDNIKGTKMEKQTIKIIVTQNNKGNLFQWLSFAKELNKYDIVGYFHTEMSAGIEEWYRTIWLKETFELLLVPAETIITTFQEVKNVGIIIPELPYYYQINPPVYYTDKNIILSLQSLWNKMNCKKEINFKKLDTIIMPFGGMFWYRPAALLPLFQVDFFKDSIFNEPYHDFQTISRCIEGILVYIAWNENYDYRIITSNESETSAFISNIQYNKIYRKFHNSKSYQIGNLVLAFPKFIKKIIFK
jgi:rhamnosyltransferase